MEVLLLKILLLLTNFTILTYLLVLMINHHKSNFDKKSWAFLFHVLTFSWLTIRGVFWISTLTSLMKWTTTNFYLLYWMPTPLEFGAFMLLPLYFAQILYPVEWKKYWRFIRPVYFGLTVGIFLFQSLWSWLKSKPKVEKGCYEGVDDYFANECFHTEYSTITFRKITAACFLFLAVIQCLFGIKILNMDKNQYYQFLTTPPEIMSVVNIFLVTAFASRAFYQIMAMNELMILPDVPLEDSGDVPMSIFIAFELWIYVPTILVVTNLTSRTMGNISQNFRIPSRYGQREMLLGYYAAVPNYGTESLEEGEKKRLFSDEEEEEGFFPQFKGEEGLTIDTSETELIPIRKSSHAEVDLLNSSYNRNHSWLSETDPSRHWRAAFTPPAGSIDSQSHRQFSSYEREDSLLNYFRKQRPRGASAGSETSTEFTPGPSSQRYRSGSWSKSNSSHGIASSSKTGKVNGHHHRSELEIVQEAGETSQLVDSPSPTGPPMQRVTISIQPQECCAHAEYEYLVEPNSPKTTEPGPIELKKVESYEESLPRPVLPGQFAPTPPIKRSGSRQQPFEDNAEDEDDLGSIVRVSEQRAQFIDSSVIVSRPIAPRPTRIAPLAMKVSYGSPMLARSSESASHSYHSSTPDRDEAAREAVQIRQGLRGNRYSPYL